MHRCILYCSIAILAGFATTRDLQAQDSTAKPVDTTAAKPADTTAAIATDTAAAKPADTTAAIAPDTTAANPAAASISLKAVAGKWVINAMNDVGDVSLMTYNMVATSDSSGWSYSIAKRKPIPVRVIAVAGDSIVTEAGPYESISRKGIKVILYNVIRLRDDKLVGVSVARYATTSADSVLEMQIEGTRAPYSRQDVVRCHRCLAAIAVAPVRRAGAVSDIGSRPVETPLNLASHRLSTIDSVLQLNHACWACLGGTLLADWYRMLQVRPTSNHFASKRMRQSSAA